MAKFLQDYYKIDYHQIPFNNNYNNQAVGFLFWLLNHIFTAIDYAVYSLTEMFNM